MSVNDERSQQDVAQLGRQVVQISKTAHAIAKLVIPMCLPFAYNHQKSNCLMIRACLGNSKISLRCSSIGQTSGSNLQICSSYCKTSFSHVFALCLQSSEKQLPDDSSVFMK